MKIVFLIFLFLIGLNLKSQSFKFNSLEMEDVNIIEFNNIVLSSYELIITDSTVCDQNSNIFKIVRRVNNEIYLFKNNENFKLIIGDNQVSIITEDKSKKYIYSLFIED